MVLALDVGNSILTIGLFTNEGMLKFRAELNTNKRWTRDQCAIHLLDIFRLNHAEISSVTGTIIASVVPPVTTAICAAAAYLTKQAPLLIGPGVKTGLNIKSDIHAQMGSDIVACSVAAIAKYPTPIIIIDMGTAITMSVIHGTTYEGCVLLPGVSVALDALSERAAELPHISIEAPSSILGHNTVDAMRAGVVYGNASMLDGMIARLEEASTPAATVVGTGLSAFEILSHCKREIHYDADLLLDGLYLIYKKNMDVRQRGSQQQLM